MIATQRRHHRRFWTALIVVIPLILFAAWRASRAPVMMDKLPAVFNENPKP